MIPGRTNTLEVEKSELSPSDIPQYIANLELYTARVKELHWSCDNDKTHILCDELRDNLCEFQDELAEMYMGMCGVKFQIGFLSNSASCNANTLPELLKSLCADTCEMISGIECSVECRAIQSELKEHLGYFQGMLYKETQK